MSGSKFESCWKIVPLRWTLCHAFQKQVVLSLVSKSHTHGRYHPTWCSKLIYFLLNETGVFLFTVLHSGFSMVHHPKDISFSTTYQKYPKSRLKPSQSTQQTLQTFLFLTAILNPNIYPHRIAEDAILKGKTALEEAKFCALVLNLNID